jgi:hypothetical protein
MSSRDYLQVEAPPGRDLAEWLSTFDSSPTLLPEWPESESLAVVMVTVTPVKTFAAVVLSEQSLREVDTVVTLSNAVRRLFFTVPRSFLLRAGTCPGLTSASWRDHGQA